MGKAIVVGCCMKGALLLYSVQFYIIEICFCFLFVYFMQVFILVAIQEAKQKSKSMPPML